MTLRQAIEVLRSAGVEFSPGLTSEEFNRVEARFDFRFPADLREFLSLNLPAAKPWVDWRDGDVGQIRDRLSWPLRGICFDIEKSNFWLPEWGSRPSDLQDAFEIARHAVAAAPVLIPIFSHRYISASPLESGNPVFSVYQTDIIYYGADLLDYLQNEFKEQFGRSQAAVSYKPREITFWTRVMDIGAGPTAE